MHLSKLLPLAVLATLALVPAASAAGNGALDRRFAKIDVNNDGWLSFSEFHALTQRNKPWVDAMYRFNLADDNSDGMLSLIEFRASNGGKEGGRPSKAQRFALADLDSDGFLDPDEFARTLAQSKPARKIMREFGRKDKDDDMLLTPKEFGAGASVGFPL